MSRFYRSSSRLRLAAALLGLAANVIAAPWYEDYEKGLRALTAKHYAEAVPFFESAIKSRPEPGKSARTYGQRFVDYYPYFHLGKAYAGLGDADKASAAFEASETKGELAKDAALARELTAELGKLRATADVTSTSKPAATLSAAERKRIEDALAGAEALIAQGKAGEAQTRLTQLRASLPPQGETPEGDGLRRRTDESLGQARAAAENLARDDAARDAAAERVQTLERSVAAARGALQKGNLAGARTELDRARALDAQNREVRALEAELRDAEAKAQSSQAQQAVARLLSEAQSLFNQKRFEEARAKYEAALEREPGNADAQAGLRRAAEALAASLSDAEKEKRIAAALAEAKILVGQKQIRPAVEKLRSAEALGAKSADTVGLSRELVETARAKAKAAVSDQLQGRYDRASAALEDALAALADRASAHLYLALALYSRYLVEGEKDHALADKARARMREALKLDPRIAPDPRVVSPRLIAAFDEIRKRS